MKKKTNNILSKFISIKGLCAKDSTIYILSIYYVKGYVGI